MLSTPAKIDVSEYKFGALIDAIPGAYASDFESAVLRELGFAYEHAAGR
jgi:hypothetical protein